jgi:hypothetical protein
MEMRYKSRNTLQAPHMNNLFYINGANKGAAIILSGGACSALWGALKNNGNLFDVGIGKINNASTGCGSSTAAISQWRTDSGEESMGRQEVAILVNPLTGANSGLSNLRLNTGSAAIDAGIVLNLLDFPGSDRW